jgi:hypothetical protein
VTAPRSQQAPPLPPGEPPPIIRPEDIPAPQAAMPPAPSPRCQGVPDDVLARLRRALQAKEAHR